MLRGDRGRIVGWIGTGTAVLLGAAFLVQDPGVGAARGAVGAWLFALVVWANLLRPQIRVADGTITLVNAFRDVTVPAALVDRVVLRSYLVLEVAGRKYIGVSVGHSTRSLARGEADRARGLVSEPGRVPEIESYPAYVQERLDQVVSEARSASGTTPGDIDRRWARVPVALGGTLLTALVVLLLL